MGELGFDENERREAFDNGVFSTIKTELNQMLGKSHTNGIPKIVL